MPITSDQWFGLWRNNHTQYVHVVFLLLSCCWLSCCSCDQERWTYSGGGKLRVETAAADDDECAAARCNLPAGVIADGAVMSFLKTWGICGAEIWKTNCARFYFYQPAQEGCFSVWRKFFLFVWGFFQWTVKETHISLSLDCRQKNHVEEVDWLFQSTCWRRWQMICLSSGQNQFFLVLFKLP